MRTAALSNCHFNSSQRCVRTGEWIPSNIDPCMRWSWCWNIVTIQIWRVTCSKPKENSFNFNILFLHFIFFVKYALKVLVVTFMRNNCMNIFARNLASRSYIIISLPSTLSFLSIGLVSTFFDQNKSTFSADLDSSPNNKISYVSLFF